MFKIFNVHRATLLFPEEANVYDHCQHFLYARLKKKYARPEEFTDHYFNLDARDDRRTESRPSPAENCVSPAQPSG